MPHQIHKPCLALIILTALNLTGCGNDTQQNLSTALAHARSLAQSANVYASVRDDHYPDTVSAIIEACGGQLPVTALTDPRTGNAPMAAPPAGSDPKKIAPDVDAHLNFYYTGAHAKCHTDFQIILFYDKGQFPVRVVAFGDAHAEAFKAGSPELKAAVAAHNTICKEMNLPLLSEDLIGPPK